MWKFIFDDGDVLLLPNKAVAKDFKKEIDVGEMFNFIGGNARITEVHYSAELTDNIMTNVVKLKRIKYA